MPTVIRKVNGRLIIRSKGKRGFSTVQVTREGEQRLREKFPPAQYALHELSIDKDIFWELARAGCLYTERSGRNWVRRVNRRRGGEQPITVDHDYVDVKVQRDEIPPVRQPPVVRTNQPVTSTPAPSAEIPPVIAGHTTTAEKPTLDRLATVASVKCEGCSFRLPHGAHFCPRCGRAVQKEPQSITETSGERIFFAVLGGVAAIMVVLWLFSQR